MKDLFLYFGLIVVVIAGAFLSSEFGSFSDAVSYFGKSNEREVLREKYPIIGDKEVKGVASKQVIGDASCYDTFSNKSFKKPFTRIWIEEFEDREKRLRSFGNVLIDSGHGFSDTAIFFGRDTLPNICYISDLDRVYELAPGDEVTLAAECERESLVEDLIQDSLGDYEGYFSISVRGNSEDFSLGDTYASLKYDIECKLKVTDTSACFLRDQMTDLGGRLSYIMNGFLEYNYCDHPQNSEFISEVRDKYGSNK